MTLKRQLALGISSVLLFLSAFFAITGLSYSGIDTFITTELHREMLIARLYERVASTWIKMSEAVAKVEEHKDKPDSNAPEQLSKELHELLNRLSILVSAVERKNAFDQINDLASSYTAQLQNFQTQVESKARLEQRERTKLKSASQMLSTRMAVLSENFQKMMENFNNALRLSEFKNSDAQPNSFMINISRIEKDLLMVQTEMNSYMAGIQGENKKSQNILAKTEVADHIQQRIRATLSLLERILLACTESLHIRVLTKIRESIRSFSLSFQDLREHSESYDSELVEVGDKVSFDKETLIFLQNKGVQVAMFEADIFWNRIESASNTLMKRNRLNLFFSLASLGGALFIGLIALLIYPGRVAGPLQELSNYVSDFQLEDTPTEMKNSGTYEIEALNTAFMDMAARLKEKKDINACYIHAIKNLGRVYTKLHEASLEPRNEETAKLEGAISEILDELMTSIPAVDLAKVMMFHSGSAAEDSYSYYQCVGLPKFSTKFQELREYKEYCESVDLSEELRSEKNLIPANEGITGWLFSERYQLKIGDFMDSWKATHVIPIIQNNPILAGRKFERGLSGCIHGTPLRQHVEPLESDLAESSNEILGYLFTYFHDQKTRLSDQDLLFINIIGQQVENVIETLSLIQESSEQRQFHAQLKIAREIQENLLPQSPPEIKGLKMSVVCEPAYEVGGDYFNFFVLDENRVGVVIADAAGKGIPAALIMTIFKAIFSTLDLKNLSAGEVFRMANKIILKNMTEDRFITAAYAILEHSTGKGELACAGHNPPLLVSRNGFEMKCSELVAKGSPLGVVEFPFESFGFSFSPGDLLLLYTDGVTEARNEEGVEFGVMGISDLLRKGKGQISASDLVSAVKKHAQSAKQHDDITAIAIESFNSK